MPGSKGFKVVVTGNGHKVAACFYAPTLVTGKTRAFGKVLFLDCYLEWNELEETPKACVSFLLPSLPLCPGIPATPLCGGCFHHRWADPKEGSWMWEPHHPETWSPGDFPKLFQPRGSTSFGYSRCSLQEDPPGSGGLVQREADTPGPWSRVHWLTSFPRPSAPRQASQGTQACSGLRDVAAAQVTEA